jgi:hypothetical protein
LSRGCPALRSRGYIASKAETRRRWLALIAELR